MKNENKVKIMVFAGALVFVIAVKTTAEGRKMLRGLKKHLEPMLSISLNMPVSIWVKSIGNNPQR